MADYNSDRTGSNIDLTLDKVDALDAKVQPIASGISVAGSLGIGTDSPSAPLTVTGNVVIGSATNTSRGGGFSRSLFKMGANQTYVDIQAEDATKAAGILFSDGASGAYGSLMYDHSSDSLTAYTNSAERARIDSSGNLLVGTTSSPTGSGQIVANNGIYLGGTGAANKLDDYEEGTWTPEIRRLNGTINASYTVSHAKYTKVGNLVNLIAYITSISNGSSDGDNGWTVRGLPFQGQRYSDVHFGYAATPFEGGYIGDGGGYTIYLTNGTAEYTGALSGQFMINITYMAA